MAAVESRLLAQCGFSGTSHFPGVALDSSTCQGLDIGGRRDERTWIHTLMERSAEAMSHIDDFVAHGAERGNLHAADVQSADADEH